MTLVWFENNEGANEVDVKGHSRSLFVDINKSSQQIALSRKILLDEKVPSEFLTRTFYDFIASHHGFLCGNNISLFHSGFDFPTDLRKNPVWCPTSIFVPEIIDLVIRSILYNDNVNGNQVSARAMVGSHTKAAKFDRYIYNTKGKHAYFHETVEDIDDNKTSLVKPENKSDLLLNSKNVSDLHYTSGLVGI